MKYIIQYLGALFLGIALLSCNNNQKVSEEVSSGPLFRLLENEKIGIDFSNDLESTMEFNVYKYRNFYNGGGVALGDINNDGLIDIYMVSNQSSNKLYLNKGDLTFEDITDQAGVSGQKLCKLQ